MHSIGKVNVVKERQWIFADMCSRKLTLKLILAAVAVFVILQIDAIPRYIRRVVWSNDYSDKSISINVPMKTDPKLDGYSWLQCKCKGERNLPSTGSVSDRQSTCSKEASNVGPGQKVISYSLFVATRVAVPHFFNGIAPNLKKLRDIYPGWMVRIYTNVPINEHSCSLICQNDHLFWCNIEYIPELGDLSSVNGRVWRFLPLGDPTVDIFVSRDLDTIAIMREKGAVAEWEASNKTFHVMRDSPWHCKEILAGMWGAKNTLLNLSISVELRNHIIEDAKFDSEKTLDQAILKRRVFYPFRKDLLAHDSYFCGKYNESVTLPFPTKRNGKDFVGYNALQAENAPFVLNPCPMKCRPSYASVSSNTNNSIEYPGGSCGKWRCSLKIGNCLRP